MKTNNPESNNSSESQVLKADDKRKLQAMIAENPAISTLIERLNLKLT